MTNCVTMRLRNTMAVFLAIGVVALIVAASSAECRTSSETSAALRKLSEGILPQSPAQRVDTRLKLLQEEMASPSTPGFGIGGGPIDTGYVQEVIMGTVCTFAQKGAEREEIRRIVAAKLASTPVPSQALRDRLTIILGHCGDTSVGPRLVEIIEKHPDGFMRFGAAMALREMPEYTEAIPALRRVVAQDTYARIRFSDSKQRYDSVTMVYSPVRAVAVTALYRMGQSVPKGAEVVPAKYGVQTIAPLLYDSRSSVCTEVIEILGTIGSAEAEAALQTFIDKKKGMPGAEGLVSEARQALQKLQTSPNRAERASK